MGKVLVTDTYLTNIGNAIRSKNGTTDTYKPSEMASAIENIETGGGSSEKYRPQRFSFKGCTAEDMSYETANIDVSAITTMPSMFEGCTNVKSLDLSSWELNNITSFYNAFKDCKAVTEIKLPVIDTTKVTTFYGCFWGCTKLTRLDLSSWTTDSATNVGYFFNNCTSLKHLDIRNMTFTKVGSNYSVFFSGVPLDCEIIVKSSSIRTWIKNQSGRAFTNIKTVAELEAEV
jgi:surface protein